MEIGYTPEQEELRTRLREYYDYPLYRYFLLSKQLELSLGSATPSLLRLGALLADTPVR